MKIKNDQLWMGAFPRANPTKLGLNQATYAANLRLDSGAIKPWKGPALKDSIAKLGTNQTIYRWGAVPGDEDSGFWFHWPFDVDVVPGPINGDTESRTYFTGDEYPKYTYAGIATGAGEEYPNASRKLGVPQPGGSVIVSAAGTPDPDINPELDFTETIYCIVFVTDKGEWGPPGAFSLTLKLLQGQIASLSSITGPPGGDYVIASKRIYRLASGTSGTVYYFVDEIPVSQTNYVDSKTNAELGQVLISTNWYPPPDDMFGIGITANGVAYGFSGKQICLSEPYLPHAWNPENQKTTGTDIIGGVHVRDMIVVFDYEKVYLVTGIDPSTMTVDEINNYQTCVSKRSIVSMTIGVVYASPDGLILIRGQNDYLNLTEAYFDEKAWRALKPETILGCVYEGKYIGFYDDGTIQGGFILDPKRPEMGIMFIDVHATAAYRDPLTDKLYLVINDNEIHEFNEGVDLTGTWNSGTAVFPNDRKFAAARILVEGSITARIFIDGNLIDSSVVTTDKPYRIPMVRGRKVKYELEGTGTVSSFELAESMGEFYG